MRQIGTEQGTACPAAGDSVLTSYADMDLHRLAEERSVAYHRVIAERLRSHPEILEMARRRVRESLASATTPPFASMRWADLLAGDISSIEAFLVERSEIADELRQSSPFAGALDPRERWRIWRDTRERLSLQP